MINRKELKRKAKLELKKAFWQGYLLVLSKNFIQSSIRLVCLFITTSLGLAIMAGSVYPALRQMLYVSSQDEIFSVFLTWISISKYLFIIRFVQTGILIVCQLLLFNHLQAGENLWFSRNRETSQPARFSYLFYNLRAKRYGGIFLGLAWRDFWQGIWRLPNFIMANILSFSLLIFSEKLILFYQNIYSGRQLKALVGQMILPLILGAGLFGLLYLVFAALAGLKTYAYRAAEWILADNPSFPYRQALKLSQDMVKGYKWQWFVLDLSFIGWYLLFILLAPFYLFTWPLLESYMRACYAEFYSQIRDRAVAEGKVRMEDLGFVRLNQPTDKI